MDKFIYGLITTFCMIFCFAFVWMVVTTDNKPREQSNDLSSTPSSIRVVTSSSISNSAVDSIAYSYDEENKKKKLKEEELLRREAARIGNQSAVDAAVYSYII